MSGIYVQYPTSGSGSGIATYPNFAAFPASAPNGTPAIDLSTDNLYIYSTNTGSWQLVGGPGSAFYPIVLSSTSQVTGILASGNGGTGTSASWTQGSVIFATSGSAFGQNNSQFFWDNSNNRLGLLTNIPSTAIGIGGNANATIGMERTTGSSGLSLTLGTGGALSGATDANGGTLILRSGISTGVGLSKIFFQTYTASTSSGVNDNVVSTKMVLTEAGNLGIGTPVPATMFTLSGNRTTLTALGAATPVISDISINNLTDAITTGSVTNFFGTRYGSLTYLPSNPVTITTAATLRVQPIVSANINSFITNNYSLIISAVNISVGSSTTTNGYGLSVTAPTGAANNYAATYSGNVGMGTVTDPQVMLEIAAGSKTVSSSEQLCLRSQRNAIVTNDMIGGISFRSNDTNLTAPGTIVSVMDAVAEATHTASVLDTGIAFYTTKTLLMSESMRISGAGFVGIGTQTPQVPLDVRGVMRINGSTSGFFGLQAAASAGSTTFTAPVGTGSSGQALTTDGTGVLSWAFQNTSSLIGSVSLVNQVSGNLPIAQTSGSVSLVNRVTGNLPLSQTSGSISLVNQVTGNLPLSQTSGILPVLNGGTGFATTNIVIGSITLGQAPGGNTYPLSFPASVGSTNWVLQSSNGAGSTSWVNGLTNPMTTGGDIIYGGAGGTPTRLANVGSATNAALISNGGTNAPSWANSELVYYNTSNTSISNVGSGSVISWTNKVIDTNNRVTVSSNWAYTAATTGPYQISAAVTFATATWSVAKQFYMQLYVNGIQQAIIAFQFAWSANGTFITLNGSIALPLNANDVVQFRAFNNNGVQALDGVNTNNWVSILRLI